MRSSTLTRILALITGLLLVGLLIFGVAFMKRRLAASQAAETAASVSVGDGLAGSVNGPFTLYTTTSKIGAQTYLSFTVYYQHNGSSELWYTCGRMFPAGDVEEIAWANSEYDIRVQMKNGTRELFSYDGNGEWL